MNLVKITRDIELRRAAGELAEVYLKELSLKEGLPDGFIDHARKTSRELARTVLKHIGNVYQDSETGEYGHIGFIPFDGKNEVGK